MDEILVLYLFSRLDGIKDGLAFALTVGAVLCAILFVIYLISKDDPSCDGTAAKNIAVLPRKAIRNTFIGVFILNLLLPTQRDMAIIIGGKLAADAARSETAQKLLVLVNQVLDKEIEALKKKHLDKK